jgi:hypothetical protein
MASPLRPIQASAFLLPGGSPTGFKLIPVVNPARLAEGFTETRRP